MDDRGRLLEAIDRIPSGRVVGLGTLAATTGMDRRLVMGLLQQLTPEERASHPWHRVVQDGGAIGRHPWREQQIAGLRAEGIPVAPAGIVQELAERRVVDLDNAPPALFPPAAPATGPSRARGMKGRPSSSV
jgi:alkylated DNA nucleotide flippase Atl1